MRIDPLAVTFALKAEGATLLDIDTPTYDVLTFGVEVTAVAGSPTNFTVHAYPFAKDGTTLIDGGNSLNTGAKTAVGVYLLDLWGTTEAQITPAIENTFTKWRLLVNFTAGTAPTITGKVLAFQKHF